jgi:hypothetical protein
MMASADFEVPLMASADIQVLLRHHKRLVLKPTMGTNSGGLLCLSLDQIEPLRFVPMPSGEPRPRLATPPNLSNGSLWAYAPVKALSAGDASVREVRRARWFAELILMMQVILMMQAHLSLAGEPRPLVRGAHPHPGRVHLQVGSRCRGWLPHAHH